MASIVPRILADNAWQRNGLLIITWDEGTSNLGCCTLAAGGRVPTLVIRPHSARGAHSSTPITHYSVLRTIEARWGLDVIGHSGDSGTPALLDIFTP